MTDHEPAAPTPEPRDPDQRADQPVAGDAGAAPVAPATPGDASAAPVAPATPGDASAAPDTPVTPGAPATPGAGRAPAASTGTLVRVVVALVLGLVAGRLACAPDATPPARDDGAGWHGSLPDADAAPTIWTCSMHPQIRLPEPGQCPLCGMDLIPLVTDDSAGLSPSALRVSENAAALAGLVTAPVERRAAARELRLVGRVAFDETRLSYITAWVPSRLDRLYVDYTGVPVRKGDHMVEVYSPDLIATQQELLSALHSARILGDQGVDVLRDRQQDSVRSARERLRLWGLTPEQIDAIEQRDEPLEHITINAPVGGIVVHKNALQGDYVQTGTRIYTIADLTRVWVQLDAYESDLAWLHYGQHVEFQTVAWPGRTFAGRISFIDPVLDDRTRTIKVRVNVENPDLDLKPDMFVRATVAAPMTASGRLVDAELADLWMCPMHPEAVSPTPAPCPLCGMAMLPTAELGFRAAAPEELPLVIPDTAPLVTGTRAVVYVRLPGDGPPVFEGREIVLGPRADGVYLVREGLAEGEQVVVHGAFKLDSELQIRARPSMMSPDGGAGPSGHDHGSARMPAADPEPARLVTPVAFRGRLGALLEPLTAASRALAADDTEAARAAGTRLVTALGAVPMAALDQLAHGVWMPLSVSLSQAATTLASATDIAALRAALRDGTDAAVAALDRFGWQGEGELPAIFHCPMAFDGAGADWLDVGDAVSNPYYGAAMLRCGERQRTIAKER